MCERVSSIVYNTIDKALKTKAGLVFVEHLKTNNQLIKLQNFKRKNNTLKTLIDFEKDFDEWLEQVKKIFKKSPSEVNNFKKIFKEIVQNGKIEINLCIDLENINLSVKNAKKPVEISQNHVKNSKKPVEISQNPVENLEKKTSKKRLIVPSSREKRLNQLSLIQSIFLHYNCNFDAYLSSNSTSIEEISSLSPPQFLQEIFKMADDLWFCGELLSNDVKEIKKILSNVSSEVELQSNFHLEVINNVDKLLKNNRFSNFLKTDYGKYGENELSQYLVLFIQLYDEPMTDNVKNQLNNILQSLINEEIRQSTKQGKLSKSESLSKNKEKFIYTTSEFSNYCNLNDFNEKPECMSSNKTSNKEILYNNKPLELINVLGDGTCFYHSIAHVLRNLSKENGIFSQVTGHELRSLFVDFLRSILQNSLSTDQIFAVNYIYQIMLAQGNSNENKKIFTDLLNLLKIDRYEGSEDFFKNQIKKYLNHNEPGKLINVLISSVSKPDVYFTEVQAMPFADFLKTIGNLENFKTTIDGFIILSVTREGNAFSTYPYADRDDNRILVYLAAAHYNAVKKTEFNDYRNYIFSAGIRHWSGEGVQGNRNYRQFL